MRTLPGLAVAAVALVSTILLREAPPVRAANLGLVIQEVLAGANGDSAIQFIEIGLTAAGQNCWGPQVATTTAGADSDDGDCLGTDAPNETRSRAALLFYDAAGRETGRYKFPENPPPGANTTVFVGTQAFASLTGAPAPDFVMPPLLNAINGKVCFSNNPENVNADPIRVCVSYGSFAGANDGEGAPAPAMSTTGTISLARQPGTTANLSSQFSLADVPTPTNSAGQTFVMALASAEAQGEALFTRETFGGNGRTCATCHVASLSNRLTPANVQSRFATLSTTLDPLFIAESTMNLNTLTVADRPIPAGGTDFLNTSGGDLRGVITASTTATARVLGRTSATTYLVQGGLTMGGIATDAAGNQAVVASVSAGDLNALENPTKMRTSRSGVFPQGRALILENIDGFENPPVFRKSPHLLNLRLTAPFGFSGTFADLQTFATGAVQQHFTRTLSRGSAVGAPDFRQPTTAELVAMEAFLLDSDSIPGSDPNKFDLDRYVTTAQQQQGRTIFFSSTAKCSMCHGGPVLATTTANILGKGIGVNASFNTGVASQGINRVGSDDLPCEPTVGACNTREFSVPQLFNIADLGPFLHDASAATLSAAISFYNTSAFSQSPAARAIGGVSIGSSSALVAFLSSLTAAPKVGDLASRTVRRNQTIDPIAFVVKDPDTPLANLTWTISSSDPALFPAGSMPITGTGNNRTLTLTPAPTVSGRADITVTASDGSLSGSNTTTIRVNDPPTISSVPDRTIVASTSTGPLPFTVADEFTTALTVSRSTSNSTLVPSANIVVSGTGSERTVTVTPTANRGGSAVISLTVSDGLDSTTSRFTITVNKPADPRMWLDAPTPDLVSTLPLLVGGWAIDTGAATGPGVDTVHVYAFPVSGGPPVFLGVATFGRPRPDIASVFGAQFSSSGFQLLATALTPGETYDIGAYGHSAFTNSFSQSRFARVRIVQGVPDPVMALDRPASGFVGTGVNVAGWAIDRGSVGGLTGVDALHVWAFPEDGRAPTFLGAASYGMARPDVGAVFGNEFTNSGFNLTNNALASGLYTIGVYARSLLTGTFNQERFATVTIARPSAPAMALDAPVNNDLLSQPFEVAGWALDRLAPNGTGVDVVHVWAFPVGGGSAIFAGEAVYGSARPDVGAVFGSRFANSGYKLQVANLPGGAYDLMVFARTPQTGLFSTQRVVRITIQAPPAAAASAGAFPQPMPPLAPVVEPETPGEVALTVDSPQNDTELSGPFIVTGWAVDRRATSGSGIGGVHVWASGVYLGTAQSRLPRPDVGEVVGTQFDNSGWRLEVPALPPGVYDLTVYAWSERTARFELSQTVRVTVR